MGRTTLLKAALAVTAWAAMAAPAQAAIVGSTPSPSWQTNGRVTTITVSGTTAYIGGKFTSLRPSGARRRHGRGHAKPRGGDQPDDRRAPAVEPERERPRERDLRQRQQRVSRRRLRHGRRRDPQEGRGRERQHRRAQHRVSDLGPERRGAHDRPLERPPVPGRRVHRSAELQRHVRPGQRRVPVGLDARHGRPGRRDPDHERRLEPCRHRRRVQHAERRLEQRDRRGRPEHRRLGHVELARADPRLVPPVRRRRALELRRLHLRRGHRQRRLVHEVQPRHRRSRLDRGRHGQRRERRRDRRHRLCGRPLRGLLRRHPGQQLLHSGRDRGTT